MLEKITSRLYNRNEVNMTTELLKKILYSGLVLIWMLIVFMFSNQNGEKSQGTSRKVTNIIVKVLVYNEEISKEETNALTEKIDYLIRKIAHYSLYTIGGILIYNYIKTFSINIREKILTSILVGIIYAITDELHQYFMDGRSAQIKDIVIDSLGIFTGVLLMYKIKNNLYNKNSKGEE